MSVQARRELLDVSHRGWPLVTVACGTFTRCIAAGSGARICWLGGRSRLCLTCWARSDTRGERYWAPDSPSTTISELSITLRSGREVWPNGEDPGCRRRTGPAVLDSEDPQAGRV